MQFVDGENLTIRAQALMRESEREIVEGNHHRKDCYFWPGTAPSAAFRFPVSGERLPIRSFYYTSYWGDEAVRTEVTERLWQLQFEPNIFKKPKRETKSKGVDIALTKDMLSHAFRGN
jgi:hypothetical protein